VRVSRRAGARRTAVSWDSQLLRRPFQQLLFTIAGLALLPAMAATLMRVLPPADEPIVQLAAFIPYGLVGYLIALSCLLVALVRAERRLVPAVITAAVVVLAAFHLAWLGPLFVKDHRAPATEEFRLMSLNMSGSESDTQEVAQRAAQADVVILIQTSPAALIALKSFGWDQRFPFSLGEPKDGFFRHRYLLPLPAEPQHTDPCYSLSAMGDDSTYPRRRAHPTNRCPSLQSVL
jgi:hypothetical protein